MIVMTSVAAAATPNVNMTSVPSSTPVSSTAVAVPSTSTVMFAVTVGNAWRSVTVIDRGSTRLVTVPAINARSMIVSATRFWSLVGAVIVVVRVVVPLLIVPAVSLSV